MSDSARAQNFPTPTKTLCQSDPTVCGLASAPPGLPVFYQVTLAPNANGAFSLLESLPPPSVFTLTGTTCTNSSTGQTFPLNASGPIAGVTVLSPPNVASGQLVSGQNVVCAINGYFTAPGAAVNSVTVADANGQPVSNPAGYNAVVAATAPLPSDLSATKSVTPAAIDISNGPQTLTYTVVIKNNGTQPVSIGPIGELVDKVSVPSTGVPLQVQLVPGSVGCTVNPSNTSCLDTANPGYTIPPWTDATTTLATLAEWHFPASSVGFIPAGGTITLTYQMQVRLDPHLFCAKGGEGIHNEANIGLTRIPNITITESNSTNNTASADVAVTTGQNIDPDCGLPMPGPVTITKQQITPPVTNGLAWGTSVSYRITLQNTDPNPVTVRLRDRVMEWVGTPPFKATVTNWSCVPSTACAPAPVTSPVSLVSYFSQGTTWDKTNITLGGANSATSTVQVDVAMTYVVTSCDSFAAGGSIVRNIGRIDYTYNSAQVVTEAPVDTIMQQSPTCKLQVSKIVQDVDQVQFGTDINYQVTYHNAENQTVVIGTLIDAMSLVQPNYATSLPFSGSSVIPHYTYNCSVSAGSVTGGVPTTGSGSGNIVYTSNPAQGVRIIQNNSPVTFGPNATLTCNVTLNISRPAPGDPYCLSSQTPLLGNLGLMDVSRFYNSNVLFPPSATYNPTAAVTVPQPSVLTNWKTVSVKLPKCYNVAINKSVGPGFTWAPGGPPLYYTITLTNAGDTLTGGAANNAWQGLLLDDSFLSGSPYSPDPNSVTVSSTCATAIPPASWLNWTGPPAGGMYSFLPITKFPAGCSIIVKFKVSGPLQPGQICNRAGTAMAPNPGTGSTDTLDWYANNPDPALLNSQVCAPVLATNALQVRKVVNNLAGAVLPTNQTYPMAVTCTIPNPVAPYTPATITVINNQPISVSASAPTTLGNLPVGATCTVTENWQSLASPHPSHCKTPAVATWQTPSYNPASVTIAAAPAQNIVTVTDPLTCVTPPLNTLIVSKTFTPPSVVAQLPPNAVFPVQVACTPAPNVIVNLTPTALQQFVGSIPVGTSCSITELPSQGTQVPAYCKWLVTTPNGNSIVIPGQGSPTLSVNNALICNPPINLAVTKTGPKHNPQTGMYDFTITVTSTGGTFTPPAGALTVTDLLTGFGGSLYNMTATPAANWNCTTLQLAGGCAYTGPGPTAAGQVLGTFTISYYPFTAAAYTNCASVALSASSGLLEPDLSDNSACVHGGGPMPRVDLAIKKTGPTAVPGSPGLSAFTLTVTNPGPAFYLTPSSISVSDTVSGTFGSFSGISATPAANWSCTITGSPGPSCLYTGYGPISQNQVLGTITITYHSSILPNFTNCATVGLTASAPLQENTLGNNKFCVTVSGIKCKSPFIANAAGVCACPEGTVLLHGKCVGKIVACLAPAVANAAGICVCPSGAASIGGACRPPVVCNPPFVPNAAGTCACPEGTMLLHGKCEGKIVACLAPMVANAAGICVCPGGAAQIGGACGHPVVCKPPLVANAAGICGCPDGTMLLRGECVRHTVVCKPPLVTNAVGGCGCPEGTVLSAGKCVPQTGGSCKPPLVANAVGGCGCPEGTALSAGKCVPQTNASCKPPMIANAAGGCGCPAGTLQSNGECVRQAACEPPMVANAAGACACPPGQQQNGQQCIGGAIRPEQRDPFGTMHAPSVGRGHAGGLRGGQ